MSCAVALRGAIRGKGAFRLFKNIIYQCGVEQDWYQFKRAAVEHIVMEWLDEHQIFYGSSGISLARLLPDCMVAEGDTWSLDLFSGTTKWCKSSSLARQRQVSRSICDPALKARQTGLRPPFRPDRARPDGVI